MTFWWRRAKVGLGISFLAFMILFCSSFIPALLNPSYGASVPTRAAEWFRGHGLGGVVNLIETEWYRLNPPKVGGKPPAGSFTGPTLPPTSVADALPTPTRLVSPAGAWLPGEGVWHAAGRTVGGVPAVLTTTVRPDGVHTSYVVGVAWMDPTLLQAQLYSGSTIPGGGPYPYTAPITAKSSENLVAAFNAGFRMSDANGGYYTNGRTIVPLRNGAASVVVFKDGTMTVAKWGTDVTMSNQVASVRQNLDLIVQNSRPVPGLTNANVMKWGKTLGGGFNVWRSGLGVTKDGALVYVGGPSLSISDLANVLVRAGAVRAMELDINTDWVQFSAFKGPLNTPINGGNGTSLESAMAGTPSRYFATWWTRDFYTMTLRAKATRTAASTSSSTTTSAG
jgi:uncharacterized protein YigE (DUF2233 family)